MAAMSVQASGIVETRERLKKIAAGHLSVSKTGVGVATKILAEAARQVVKGSIKNEIGRTMHVQGDVVKGRAGFIKFPREGDGQNGPHGVYLELGTSRGIEADPAVATAMAGARGTAITESIQAMKLKIEKLSKAE